MRRRNSEPIINLNFNRHNVLAELDKDKESVNIEKKMWKIHYRKEAQRLKKEIIVLEERCDVASVTVDILEKLVNGLNKYYAEHYQQLTVKML